MQISPLTTVTTTYKDAQSSHDPLEEEIMETPVEVPANPANAKVAFRLTNNLGNYRSLTVEVSVSIPTAVENIDATIEEAKAKAEAYLGKYMAEATEALTAPVASAPAKTKTTRKPTSNPTTAAIGDAGAEVEEVEEVIQPRKKTLDW